MKRTVLIAAAILSCLVPVTAQAAPPNPLVTRAPPATAVPSDPSHAYPFFSSAVDLAPQGYRSCFPGMTPDQACQLLHNNVQSYATAKCEAEACFDINEGVNVRIVAADEEGPFPNHWFAWTNSEPYVTGDRCRVS